MRLHLVAMALLLTGCVPAADSERGKAEIDATAQAEATDQATPIPGWTPPPATPTPKPAPSPVAEAAEAEKAPPEPVSLCWMDYCPCDTSDPDYGGSDPILCRRLRAGLPVEPELMSIGAGGRDARKQLREFRRDNPGSF